MPVDWHFPTPDERLSSSIIYNLLNFPLASIPLLATFTGSDDDAVRRRLAVLDEQRFVDSVTPALLGRRTQHLWHMTPRGWEHLIEMDRYIRPTDDPDWRVAALPHPALGAKTFENDLLSLSKRLPRIAHFLTLYTVAAHLLTAIRQHLGPTVSSIHDENEVKQFDHTMRFDWPISLVGGSKEYHFVIDAVWHVGKIKRTDTDKLDPDGQAFTVLVILDDGLAPPAYLHQRCARLRAAQRIYRRLPPILVVASDLDRARLWQIAINATNHDAHFEDLVGALYIADLGFGWPLTRGVAPHNPYSGEPVLEAFSGREATWNWLFQPYWTNTTALPFFHDGRPLYGMDESPSRLLRDLHTSYSTASLRDFIVIAHDRDERNRQKHPQLTLALAPGKRPHLRLGDYADHAKLALTLGQRYAVALTSIATSPLIPITDWASFMDLPLTTAEQYIRDLRSRNLVEIVEVWGNDIFPSWGRQRIPCVRATLAGLRFVEAMYKWRRIPAWESYYDRPSAHDPAIYHLMHLTEVAAQYRDGSVIWRTGPQISMHFADEDDQYHAIRPDAAGPLLIDGQHFPICLEFDRSTENIDNLVTKIKKYMSYAEHELEEWRQYPRTKNIIPIRLLWVTTTEIQMKSICALLQFWNKKLIPGEPIVFASYVRYSSDCEDDANDMLDDWWRRIPYEEGSVALLDRLPPVTATSEYDDDDYDDWESEDTDAG